MPGPLITLSVARLINTSSLSLLAFGFVSPWLLWGLVLGGVPILIQWLHRRNYTERVWAAMRFLQAATRAQSRRLRFESLLLLALRTLILLLVALAVAEPFLESAGWLPTPERSVHRIVLLDTSLSLQYESDGRPVSQRAREAARRVLGESRPGDSVQIVTTDRQRPVLVGQPAFDTAQVLNVLDQLTWTESAGDVDAALRQVQRLLDEFPRKIPQELILISDFQRSSWWPAAPEQQARMQRQLAELADECELSLIHVGDPQAANLAIGPLQVTPLPVTPGTTVEITAEVSRSGRSAAREVALQLVENDRVLQTATVDLGTSPSGSVSLTARWREPGWHGLELRLPTDGLTADNHRWLAVDVRDALDVLLVNGRQSGQALGRATDFVELALAPASPSEQSPGSPGDVAYRPVVVSEAELARTDLSGFDCVFLCDVPFLSQAEQTRLRTFVQAGGGLVIGSGPQMQRDAYSQWLADQSGGLLSVSLLEIVGGDDLERPFHFAEPPADPSPIIEPFVGNPQAGLTTANVYRYVRCEVRPPAGGPADAGQGTDPTTTRVALAYNNGDPAILESEFGSGRVLLITTSLDDGWGSWALWPSFLPMMHRLVDHATSGRVGRPTLVGDAVHRDYPVQTVGLSATLQQPDGRRRPARQRLSEGLTQVWFDDVSQSGLYRILLGPPLGETELLAVNVDPAESNLSLLDGPELQATLLSGVEAELSTGHATTSAEPASSSAPSRLTRWLLIVVLVLMLVEQLMAWRPRWGLIGLVASPLLLGLFALWPALTIVLIALGLGGIVAARWWGVEGLVR